MKEELKEIKTVIPDGYEIDRKNSTFERIILKKKDEKRWRDDENAFVNGYYITSNSEIIEIVSNEFCNNFKNRNIFATEKHAKSALAMARISQIMANDPRFGGFVTDEEWNNSSKIKHIIKRYGICVKVECYNHYYHFLAFHTKEQRDLFLKENEDLVRDYLMLD